MEDDLKILISQQPLIGSSSNFKLSSGDQTKIKMHEIKRTYRRMEEELKILIVECLSNHWADLPKIWNLGSGYQIKIKMQEINWTSKGSQPQNIKSSISQHPLIKSSSNFKWNLR